MVSEEIDTVSLLKDALNVYGMLETLQRQNPTMTAVDYIQSARTPTNSGVINEKRHDFLSQYRKTLMITDVTDNTVKKIGDIKKNQGIDIHISDDTEDGNEKDDHGSGKSIIDDQSPQTKAPPPGITSCTLLKGDP